MKTKEHIFPRLLCVALVIMMALAAVVPAFAAAAESGAEEQDNLTVRIRNNEGLPAMSKDQFSVYQLFKGSAHKESDEAETNEWDAFSWNNYTLADIVWGDSVSTNVAITLKTILSFSEWAKVGKDGKNVFDDWTIVEEKENGVKIPSAVQLAEILAAHPENDFMQHFANTVMQVPGLKPLKLTAPEGKTNPEVSCDRSDNHSSDSLTFTFTEPGYYMFAETGVQNEINDAVSEYILAVLGDQDILLKASIPTVDKEIVKDTGDEDPSTKDVKGDAAGVSDYVQFKLIGTLPKNIADYESYKYVFHDTLSKGLTYVSGNDDEKETHPLTVTVYPSKTDADNGTGGTVVPMTYGVDSATNNYTVSTPGKEEPAPQCSLEISFADLKALKKDGESAAISLTSESVVVVTYYAKVTEDAVIGSAGNPNDVYLEYSNDPNHDGTGRTNEERVYVYAFGLDLTKVASDTGAGLEGAGFVLKNEEGEYAYFKDQYTNKERTEFSDTKTESCTEGPVRRLIGWADADWVENWIESYEAAEKALEKAKRADKDEAESAVYTAKSALSSYLLESGEKGKIPDVYGLDEGKYTLSEIITPDGYNTMDDYEFSIKAVIDENGILKSVTYTPASGIPIKYDDLRDGPDGDIAVRFKSGLLPDNLINQKAPFLPFTGGRGTVIFYAVGGALIVGVVVYLAVSSKKRRKTDNNA